jgi:hypothetical protein
LKNKVVNQNERSKKLKWLQWKEEGNKGTKINFVTWILGWTRVLKPGPVVDSAGSRVLTGSLGQFFFLTQNNVVLVKKINKSTGYNQVFDRVLPSQLVGSPLVVTSPVFS